MPFSSILFKENGGGLDKETVETPAFFVDLNLDQIIETIISGKAEYNLKPFFQTSLHDIDAIMYRHEVMRDLENEALFGHVRSFAKKMRLMREHLVQVDKLYYKYQKQAWFLDAVGVYCDAVSCLGHDLETVELGSRGFLSFREYVTDYIGSARFESLLADTKKLKADFLSIRYCILIRGNTIKVRKYENEIDYSASVEETFEKFKQGAAKDYQVKFPAGPSMNHVESTVVDFLAELFPDIFSRSDDYWEKNRTYVDEKIGVFDREVQFYVSYLEHIATLKQAGLGFCYPHVSKTSKEIHAKGTFDLALACKLIGENSSIVCNDFYLKGKERVLVVSGPNQGGKTTFARTFGQLNYLASIGCPVAGREAQLFLFDRLFTHFEKEEDITTLRGKLEDDLVRIRHILDEATPDSIIIMNEIFNSTTLRDAIFLGKGIMEKIMQLDALCVCVTFIVELASLSEKTVSMVGEVAQGNPAVRTYKLLRKPADGLSYALSIAEKYQLTSDCLRKRVAS